MIFDGDFCCYCCCCSLVDSKKLSFFLSVVLCFCKLKQQIACFSFAVKEFMTFTLAVFLRLSTIETIKEARN